MNPLKQTHGKNSLPELKAIKGPFTRPTGPADLRPAFFTKEPEMTQPKKNYHRYTDINNKKHKQVLPPGKFLKVGDILESTDLYLYSGQKYLSVGDEDKTFGDYNNAGNAGKPVQGHWADNLCYRPDPKPKKVVEPEAVFKVGDMVKVLVEDVCVGDNLGTIVRIENSVPYPYQVKLSGELPMKYANADDSTIGLFKVNEIALAEEAPSADPKPYPNTKMPGTNDPNYYYLKVGDTVLEGDETITGLGWRPSMQVGNYLRETNAKEGNYRRLIKKERPEPKKYIFLEEGDTIKLGDETFMANKWMPVIALSKQLPGVLNGNVGRYRREVK